MADQSLPVVHLEELERSVDDLLSFAREQGQLVRRMNPSLVYTTHHPDVPAESDLLREDLLLALEDEIVPAPEITDSGGILPWELDHELVKKALIGLKLPSLRNVARASRVSTGGTTEDVATRIAQHYKWDEQEIARLILEHEGRELLPKAGHIDRLIPLESAPDLEFVKDRLERVTGRYIRIGVARWFLFERLVVADDLLEMTGSVRSYRAFVDDSGDEPSVASTPHQKSVVVRIEAGSDILRIRQSNSADARAAALALQATADVKATYFIPLPHIQGLTGSAIGFDRSTLFMLDLLDSRLRDAGLVSPDLNVARFKVGESATSDWDEETLSPTLEAVRFEGRHILDSTEACRLIATESRALVNVSLRATSARRQDGESGVFPIQIGLDGWHVFVSTGLGSTLSELSGGIHENVVDAASAEIRYGVSNVSRLAALADRITERAGNDRAPARADILLEMDDPSNT